MILSETMFFEPHRAFQELVTELDGLSYYTEVWQGTIGPNFVWNSIKLCGKLQEGSIWLIKPCFTKYHFFWDTLYSSEPKFRRRRFGTFWRFLTFNLAKLSLKSETSRMEMNLWKKVFTFCSPGLKLLKLWIYGWYPDVASDDADIFIYNMY